jgi:hypothetical protein
MSAGTGRGLALLCRHRAVSGRTDDGREGAFTAQHGGPDSDTRTWYGHVVPKTGTGDFAGWSGYARIQHDDNGAYVEIDLDA